MRLFSSGKWNQYFAGAIGSLSFGLCSAAYVWLNPVLKRLQEPNSPLPLTNGEIGWVGSLPEMACLFSPIPIGYLTDLLGRRTVLLATAPIQAITWLAIYFTHHAYILYGVRFVQGLLLGAVCTVLPMYLAEIADKNTRGRLGVMSSLGWNFGCLFEYCVGPFTGYETGIWVNLALPVLFVILFYGFHESPYFLVMRGRTDEARRALSSFRDAGSAYDKELEEIEDSIASEQKVKSSWSDLLLTSAGRNGLIVIFVINVTFNMSGAMSILIFCSKTFSLMTGQDLSSDLFTIGMGAILTLVPFITTQFIDRYGRRPTLLISYTGSTLCLIPATIFFFMKESGGYDVTSWAVFPIIGIALYPTLINFGAMIIGHTYQAELFSNSTRSLSSALGTLLGSTMASLSVQLYEPFETNQWDRYTYLMYTLFALTGLIYCYFYAPETKGKTFDEIQKEL